MAARRPAGAPRGAALRRRCASIARSRLLAAGPAIAALLFAMAAAALASVAVERAGGSALECQPSVVTALSEADAWIATHTTSNKGSDAILNVDADPVGGDSRALVRFALPAGIPAGCVVESAVLRLFTSGAADGARVEVVRVQSGWSESVVVWSNQPGAAGAVSSAWSREGYMQWRVTAQVQAMLEGENHGFLVRDAAEGAPEGGGGHGFYSREKGESPPQLVIRFGPPPSGEAPGPPAAPEPAAVRCGQVLTQSTTVTNDLTECQGDGLVIGADRIILDLGGHTIDGVGLGTGILNDGYAEATIRNGTVQQFDYGVELRPESKLTVVEELTLRLNELAAVELFDSAANEVRGNTVTGNGDGIALLSGTRDSVVADNEMTQNSGAGLLVVDSNGNRLERNGVSGGGDLGIGLERASGNTLLGNVVSGNSDGGIELLHGSHQNRLEDNEIDGSGDTGIMVDASHRNELVRNTTRFMSDSGIALNDADDGVVRGNDVRFSPGGLELDGSSRNLIESNDASNTSGHGIELGGGSLENVLVGNVANENSASGIYVADEALEAPGNVLTGNTANRNRGDGIAVAKGGHTITANVVRDNGSWGITATGVNVDGLGNIATGNVQVLQCQGVVCKADWSPPETTIDGAPADPSESSSATFAFSGTDDSTPAAGLRFQCRLDGKAESAFVACTSPRTFAGLAPASHTFEVRAIDLLGNVDPTPASYTWTVGAKTPTTTIDSAPPAFSSSDEAEFRFSADVAGSTFACALDGAGYEPCVSSIEYKGLADGQHEFRVRATDPAGNVEPEPAAHGWTVDTSPPATTIEDGPADPTNATSASFRFVADEEGVTFACSLDRGAFEDCSSPAEHAGLAAGRHTLRVRARDRAGNVEPEPAEHAWTIDLTAPKTAIDAAPPDPAGDDSASFEFSSAEDGASFACRLDGGEWEPCSSPRPYAGLAEGRHRFDVRATDAAGNVGDPAGHSWTVDLTAPETAIEAGPADPSNDDSPSFAFAAGEDGASFECRLDEGEWASCASPRSYAKLGEGRHGFAVRAIDAAGNTDASPAVHAWAIDLTAPETSILSAPADPSNDDSPSFAFSTGEPGATFECRLDAGAWASCESPRAYGGLADGAHVFEVRATDRAGNVDASPAAHEWTVDTVAPETSILSAPADPSNDAVPSFAFSASEAGSAFACRLDEGAWTACESPRVYAGLADGEHRFEVRATDRAGNTDASPAAHRWTLDTLAPDTTIDSAPTDPTKSTDAVFAFSADASGSSFECRLDGGAWAACSSPRAYASLALGRHTFEVRATDGAGNTDASPATYRWTIEAPSATPPETTITAGPPALTASSSASFAFVSSEAGSMFECRLDSGAWAGCSSPRAYAGLADGPHSFEVRAIDGAGNVDPSPASRAWTVDATPPETSIASGPAATTTSSSATFAFSSGESGAAFECSLDGAPFAACVSPREYTGLGAGAHEFRVRATDAAGNVDASPASYVWTVQTAGGCNGSVTVTVNATADSWVLQTSPTKNYGSDSVVKVDTKASANARALFRFALPASLAGCLVSEARLRLYAGSSKAGRALQALALGATWTERGVTWNDQPPTVGAAATAVSPATASYVQWIVTAQVQSMYASGNHGFLIRDGVENGTGIEQAFHSREKAPDNPPQLVITFG